MSNELVPKTHYQSELDYAREVGKLIVKSGKWSKDWNEDTVAVLVLYARDLGIHPVKALMNGFDIIQGKISMKPILMSDMIRKAGHSIQILQNDATMCKLKGKRKDNGDECTVTFGLEDAKKAALLGKDNWNKWAADMHYSRAMGRLGRMLFSDVIGGAYTEDEMDDIKASDKAPQVMPEQLIQADVEVVPTVQEVPKSAQDEPTINQLWSKLCVKVPYDFEDLTEFVKDFSEEKKVSEQAIVKSALRNEEQIDKFCAAFTKWYGDEPTPATEAA